MLLLCEKDDNMQSMSRAGHNSRKQCEAVSGSGKSWATLHPQPNILMMMMEQEGACTVTESSGGAQLLCVIYSRGRHLAFCCALHGGRTCACLEFCMLGRDRFIVLLLVRLFERKRENLH